MQRIPRAVPFNGCDGPNPRPLLGGDRPALRRARAKGASPYEHVEIAQLVYLEDGRCWLCHLPVVDDPCSPQYWSRDHVVPLAAGGDHTYNNVRLAHIRCNSAKGAQLPHELFPVPTVEDLVLEVPVP